MTSSRVVFILSVCISFSAQSEPVNPEAAVLQDFDKRITEYQKLRKTVEAKLPRLKQTPAPAAITAHEHELAAGIREARRSAKQGDIFTVEISAGFRRLIGIAMQGPDAVRIKESLNR